MPICERPRPGRRNRFGAPTMRGGAREIPDALLRAPPPRGPEVPALRSAPYAITSGRPDEARVVRDLGPVWDPLCGDAAKGQSA